MRVYAAKSYIALKRSRNAVGGPMLLKSASTKFVHAVKSHIALKRSGNAVGGPMLLISAVSKKLFVSTPPTIVSFVEGPTSK